MSFAAWFLIAAQSLTLLGVGRGGGVNPLTANLSACYAHDEASGNLIDLTAGAHNGVETSGTIASAAGAAANTATSRDYELTDSEYFLVANNTDISMGTGDFTVAFWVRIESTGVSRFVFSKEIGASPFNGYAVAINTSQAIIARTSSGTLISATGPTVTNGVWTHIVVTRVAAVVTFYQDGSSTGTGVSSLGDLDAAADMEVGASSALVSNMDGLLDELMFWKGRALSSGDVTLLYNGGAGTGCNAIVP